MLFRNLEAGEVLFKCSKIMIRYSTWKWEEAQWIFKTTVYLSRAGAVYTVYKSWCFATMLTSYQSKKVVVVDYSVSIIHSLSDLVSYQLAFLDCVDQVPDDDDVHGGDVDGEAPPVHEARHVCDIWLMLSVGYA
jgi:hypothetical protein